MKKLLLHAILWISFSILILGPAPAFAQWEMDRRLTFNDSISFTSVNNAWCVAASGNFVHVIWGDERDRRDTTEVYYKRSTDGGTTWESDTRLTYNAIFSYPYDIAIAASGPDVHVVWSDFRDGGYPNSEIYYKRSTDNGASWSPDIRLTNAPYGSFSPCVTTSGRSVHVVWTDDRDGNNEIYYNRSTDEGVTWGPDQRLTNGAVTSLGPSISVSGANVHVVWYEYQPIEEIFYKRSTDNGMSWFPDTCLTNDPAWSAFPSISVSGPVIHIAWSDTRAGCYEIYYKRSSNGGGTWTSDRRITFLPSDSYFPSLCASGALVHLTWIDQRDGPMNDEVYYTRSTDEGLNWDPDTRLTWDSSSSRNASIAASGSAVHVVWSDNRDSRYSNWEIYYKRNPTGNLGVEQESPSRFFHLPCNHSLTVFPNPFYSFATIPGHEKESFALYGITGRQVRICSGDRIGKDLSPGVYFVSSQGHEYNPLRIVKLK